jgi:hypothetical protein
MEKKDLNNKNIGGGIPPSSKSRSKRRPGAGAGRYPSRPNDAAMRIPQRKRPNALKHGIFALNPTIPGKMCRNT